MKAARPSSLLVVIALVLITAITSVIGLWRGTDGEGWKQTIRSDALGYYGYLQAVFIRGDLGHEPFNSAYIKSTRQGTLNKYYAGTSVMMAPWFGIGHAFALHDPESPKDGLSAYEQKAIGVGAWVYLLLGLLALRALFRSLGVREAVINWTLIAVVLATPLLQYTAMQPGWSHVYSFAAIAGFLLAVNRISNRAHAAWVVAAGALLGLIVLIRPINVMVLLAIPLVINGSLGSFLTRLFTQRSTFLAALACIAVFCVQPLLWYAQTGTFYAYGYRGEGFHWTRPEVIKVLFGFRRGLFLWTPMMLLPALCVLLLWRTDRLRSATAMLYWSVSTYIISSWWIWYYGGGYASRVHIDHYPILVLPMVLVVSNWSGFRWTVARIFLAATIALNLAQLWQYNNGFLHHESMDRAKYAYAFLRFDEDHRNKLGGNYQEAPFNPNGMDVVLEEFCGMDHTCRFWTSGKRVQVPWARSQATVCQYDKVTEFGLFFTATTDTLPVGRALYLEVGLQRFEARQEASLTALGVTEVRNAQGVAYFYQPFRMNPIPGKPGVWQELEYRVPLPPLQLGDEVRFYLWNKDLEAEFFVDDVFMRVNAVRPYH
ncbi:MAG TPA: hypothetical protein PL070_03550 [Flavobacteriales bacterium]|nr:hypothetical protein [Flavobacteriales bacterium]